MADLKNTIEARVGVAPGTIATATIVGTAVDLARYDAATFLFAIGTMGGTAVVTPALLEGTSVASMGTVAAADLIGSPAGFGTAGGGTARVQSIGYAGHMRYVKPQFTLTSGTANSTITCTAVLSHPSVAPPA